MTADKVIEIAKREIGTVEQSGNRTKYGKAYGMDGVYWCMIFVWWCFQQAGASSLFYGGGKCASCSQLMNWAKSQKKWVTGDYKAGDVLIYDFPGNAIKTDHTGICESWDGCYATAIEGNTSSGISGSQANGDGVYRKRRPKAHILGAYRPDYEEDTMSYEDFKKYMEQYRAEQGKKPVSSWAKAAWDKLTRAKVTDGSRPGDLITREEVATMIDRAAGK